MRDYVYPSIYFAYLFFLILLVGALYFFFRSFKQGYWGEKGEEPKYRMLQDEEDQNQDANSARMNNAGQARR